jgi:ABC-type uncharacterized transport system permease subunit
VLFRNPPITYLAIILVFVLHYVLFYTRWGLRTRAVGEHPSAADTVGINVYKIRYVNVILGGALAGLAGAFLTLEGVGTFERLMTNGRGFLALAIMIFGKWTPLGAWGAALLFGFTYAMQTQLQFMGCQSAAAIHRQPALHPDHPGAGRVRWPFARPGRQPARRMRRVGDEFDPNSAKKKGI